MLSESEFKEQIDNRIKNLIDKKGTNKADPVVEEFNHPNRILDKDVLLEKIHRMNLDFADEYSREIEEYCPDADPNPDSSERLASCSFKQAIELSREKLLRAYLVERLEKLVYNQQWDRIEKRDTTVTENVQVGDEVKSVEGSESFFILVN